MIMSNLISKILTDNFDPLLAAMENRTIKENEFTDPIYSLFLSNPARKIELLSSSINHLEQWVGRHKKRCPAGGNCQHDKLVNSVIIKFKLEKANEDALRKKDPIENLIYRDIIKGFESLLKQWRENKANEKDFVNHVVGLISENPEKISFIFESSLQELNFILENHQKYECSFARSSEPEKCGYDTVLKNSIALIERSHKSQVPPKIAVAISPPVPSNKTMTIQEAIKKRIYTEIGYAVQESSFTDVHPDAINNVYEKIVERFPEYRDFITHTAIELINKYLDQHKPKCDNASCEYEPALLEAIALISYNLEKDGIGPRTVKTDKFISPNRIRELKKLESKYDLTKLIILCEELNDNWKNGNFYSAIADLRMILHFVAPLFDDKYEAFKEVHANFNGGSSFKKVTDRLLDFINVADIHAHQRANHKDPIPNESTVSVQAEMDVLLSKIISINTPTKEARATKI